MEETKNYVMGMVIGELCRIQGNSSYLLYEPHDSNLYSETIVSATANMDAVPVEAMKQVKWVRDHELAMAIVKEIRKIFSGHKELLLKGLPPFFDLDINGDSCRLTILTKKH
ncbi:MAG: hypothetical protein AB1306_03990 [Nitrospirota bacterium]